MKTINGKNYFNEKSFKEMCQALEAGEHIHVYIDCIGFSRNNATQNHYKKELLNKYGDNLNVEYQPPSHCYSYNYSLIK